MRRANALFNAGALDALLELYHPDVELRDLQHAPDVPELLRGPDALNLVVATWTEVYDEFEAEVYEYIDAHPWVICDTRWHGKVRAATYQLTSMSPTRTRSRAARSFARSTAIQTWQRLSKTWGWRGRRCHRSTPPSARISWLARIKLRAFALS